MRFPYTQLSPSIPLRPYLRIFLRNQFSTTQPMFALVDSGADYSLFPYALAGLLKLDLSAARLWNFAGTTGRLQVAYLAKVELNILGSHDASRSEFQINAEVGFCPDFDFPGGLLLGQQGFFSQFNIAFCQASEFFELQPYPESQTFTAPDSSK